MHPLSIVLSSTTSAVGATADLTSPHIAAALASCLSRSTSATITPVPQSMPPVQPGQHDFTVICVGKHHPTVATSAPAHRSAGSIS